MQPMITDTSEYYDCMFAPPVPTRPPYTLHLTPYYTLPHLTTPYHTLPHLTTPYTLHLTPYTLHLTELL